MSNNIYKYLFNKSIELTLPELLREIIKTVDYENYLTEGLGNEEKENKLQNIQELENLTSEYLWIEPREALWNFLEDISLLTDMDKIDDSDFVTLMTIHTSKWLEEKRVFVTWLEENIFPSFRSLQNTTELEEERRLMYVAMTRAKEELYLSRAEERFHFWEYIRNPESRFLQEIDKNFIKYCDLSDYIDYNSSTSFFDSISSSNFNFWEESSWTSLKNVIKKFPQNDLSKFWVWTKVSHPKFWNWIITELNWEIASIAFSWIWIKKMNIKIAPVKIV